MSHYCNTARSKQIRQTLTFIVPRSSKTKSPDELAAVIKAALQWIMYAASYTQQQSAPCKQQST